MCNIRKTSQRRLDIHKRYRERNREKLLEKRRIYVLYNKKKVNISHKKYREKNKEKIKKYQKEYRKINHEKMLKTYRNYYINNKNKWKIYYKENIEHIKNVSRYYYYNILKSKKIKEINLKWMEKEVFTKDPFIFTSNAKYTGNPEDLLANK